MFVPVWIQCDPSITPSQSCSSPGFTAGAWVSVKTWIRVGERFKGAGGARVGAGVRVQIRG